MKEYQLAEFSIFDSTEQQRQYRIKNYDSDIHAAVLYTYPLGQIVGLFEGEWAKEIQKAKISILNPRSNEWVDGSIAKKFHLLYSKYTISWNGTSIILKKKALSSYKELRDEQRGDLLAKFRSYSGWLTWPPAKYKLTVFSDKVPDAVYFFAVAVMDHTIMVEAED
jgi:hypothetical protein